MQFLKIEHSNSLKALENKEKAAILQAAVCIGDSSAMNFELLLRKDYYEATLATYQAAKIFLQKHHYLV